MSNSNDDDRTVVVNPASLPPRVPDEDDDATPSDRTVIMKPSQRAREAAAALNAERRRQEKASAADAAGEAVDFDVTQGIVAETPDDAVAPPRAAGGKGMPWVFGFVVGAVVMIGVIVAVLALL